MSYLGNGKYSIRTSTNDIIEFKEDEIEEIILEMYRVIGKAPKIANNVESVYFDCTWSESRKFDALREEIKNDAFEDIAWSDSLETILEETIEAAHDAAAEFYEENYILMDK